MAQGLPYDSHSFSLVRVLTQDTTMFCFGIFRKQPWTNAVHLVFKYGGAGLTIPLASA